MELSNETPCSQPHGARAPLFPGFREVDLSALMPPEVPPELVRILERCLAKSPQDRPPDARGLAAELREIGVGEGQRWTEQRARVVGAPGCARAEAPAVGEGDGRAISWTRFRLKTRSGLSSSSLGAREERQAPGHPDHSAKALSSLALKSSRCRQNRPTHSLGVLRAMIACISRRYSSCISRSRRRSLRLTANRL
jgi:hypothetical protein